MSHDHERLVAEAQAALWSVYMFADVRPTTYVRKIAETAIAMVDHFEQSDLVYRLAVDAAVEIVQNTLDSLQCGHHFIHPRVQVCDKQK